MSKTIKAFELKVGDSIFYSKKYFVVDWIDKEFISDEIAEHYEKSKSSVEPYHTLYTFYDDMILNFKADEPQIIFFAKYDDEFEYLGKVNYDDFTKGEYNRRIKPKLRHEILKRDKYTCQFCGKSIKNGVTLHIDHKIPFAKGGKTTADNLQTLCDKCNYGKGIN